MSRFILTGSAVGFALAYVVQAKAAHDLAKHKLSIIEVRIGELSNVWPAEGTNRRM